MSRVLGWCFSGLLLLAVVSCSHRGSNGCSDNDKCRPRGNWVTGSFREVGGPAPGIDQPLQGTITVYETSSGKIVEVGQVMSDSSGNFEINLGPGTFDFVGKTSAVSGVRCKNTKPLTLTWKPATVALACSVP
jgi:hypothetical protein